MLTLTATDDAGITRRWNVPQQHADRLLAVLTGELGPEPPTVANLRAALAAVTATQRIARRNLGEALERARDGAR